MKKIFVIVLVLIAVIEISSGYFLSIQSSYYATGHYLSSSLRLYDRLGFPNLESMFSTQVGPKPQKREEAEIENASVNKHFPLVDNHLDDCPKENLVMDILVPAQFNSHKVEEGLHTKYKIQFFNTPIFSKKYSSTDRANTTWYYSPAVPKSWVTATPKTKFISYCKLGSGRNSPLIK